MNENKEAARKKIARLVERFLEHIDEYKQGAYKEHQTRIDYIDPFFKALGWDMDNEQGLAEAYREVIHEDRLKVGRSTTAPDYCFTVYGQRKFFVDAKKPSVDVKADVSPAYQVRRYGWSARLPVAIVTDFEEFSVYECSSKPKPTDKASVSRIAFFTFDRYLNEFDFFWDIFSKEGVLKGRFDKFVQSDTKKKGTATVDEEFLKSIEEWRTYMATTIALRNKMLNEDEINYAVQKLIDRIIFLRICEDRRVEPYGELQRAAERGEVYQNLCQLFRTADEKYNSGLFNFREDRITPGLIIDNKVLKIIVKDLYYPKCEFEFSVMPADILGSVYERFLGKTIRLTPAHYAKIEDKPEVRKAGGVYYTPKYIVDYIVENTVGKLVENKSPVEASQLKICDPACGSGSFLIGAYQYLLDWHLKYYLAHPPAKKKDSPLTPDGRLTTAEKKRILLNNIYGVDIDSQAVEVTRLNLLLKAMEGETQASISQQLSMFHERVLPNLDKNIKCGNSLIGTDFYDGQTELFPEQLKKVNAFDWEEGFPEVFRQGGMPAEATAKAGFDAVIGNPPYGFHQIHSEELKPYIKRNFISCSGSFEHYFLFYEQSLKLLKNNGLHGFIVPVTWLTIPSGKSLREYVLSRYAIKEITWLPQLVFANAQVNTLISIIQRCGRSDTTVNIYKDLGFLNSPKIVRKFKQQQFIDSEYYIGIFENADESKILQKISLQSVPLKNLAKPCSGYNPYEVGKGKDLNGGPHTKETIILKPYHSDKKLDEQWKPEIIGRNLGRYAVCFSNRWVKYGPWLAAPRDQNNFLGKRILIQEITGGKQKRIIATYYKDELYHSRDVIPIKIIKDFPHPYYLLGIINSWLMTWYHHKRNPKAQKGLFPKVLVSDLKNLPIPDINKKNITQLSKHDAIVKQVEILINLNGQLTETKLETQKQQIKRIIDHTDKQIDQLVYELYGLTEEEIRVVEEVGDQLDH